MYMYEIYLQISITKHVLKFYHICFFIYIYIYIWKYKIAKDNINISIFETNEKKIFKLLLMK